jgi:hypothetical protein
MTKTTWLRAACWERRTFIKDLRVADYDQLIRPPALSMSVWPPELEGGPDIGRGV